MFVCTGGLTAKIRGQYGLNRLLHKDLSKEEFKEICISGKLDEKNRNNKRHHALDALVISFARDIKYDEKGKTVLPDFACKPAFFDVALDKVFPIIIRSKKPALRETIYALRARQEGKEIKYYMVSRFNTRIDELFKKISDAEDNVKKIFDLSVKKAFEYKLNTNPTQEEWEQFLKDFRVSGNPVYKISMTDNESGFIKDDVLNPDGSFKKHIGQYCAIGKVNGQYFRREQSNKGQIIYNDGKTWVVEQVYPFDSIVNKLKEFKAKYGKVLFWHNGMMLYLKNTIEIGKKKMKLESGIYSISTIKSNGSIKIVNAVNKEYITYVKQLLENGKAYKINLKKYKGVKL